MKTRRTITICLLALCLSLALVAGLATRSQGQDGIAAQGQTEPAGPRAPTAPTAPVGTAFTYQGQLLDDGDPIDGTSCDVRFRLYDAADAGTQIGADVTRAVTPSDGYFVVTDLDFGVAAFSGDARWLELAVRCPVGVGTYTTLEPRQPLTPTPYALSVPWSGISAVPAGLADGVDNDTTYTAGTGLNLVDGQFRVRWGGSGSATTAARSDHDHLGQTWTALDNPLVITGTVGAPDYAPLVLGNLDTSGLGLRVRSAGTDGIYIESVGDDGMQVESPADRGVVVNSPGTDGFYVNGAAQFGLYTLNSVNDGVYSSAAGDDGVYVTGATNYEGYFNGTIFTTGCTGCALLAFGVNAGARQLEPGDVVSIQGLRPSDAAGAEVLWQVVPAQSGQAAVGVVRGWAERVAEKQPDAGEVGSTEPTEGEASAAQQPGWKLVPREGPTAPGDYLAVVIYGPYPVKVSAAGGVIAAGSRLAAAADGRARLLKTVEVQGVQLAEGAPSIGIALEAATADGLIWVLVNPQ